jgi:hypothetical protein
VTRAYHRKLRGSRKGERGSRKGEGKGGRPALTLYNDPDHWIIVAALKILTDPKDQRTLAILQALDFLLTEHASIEVELGTCVRDGVEHGRLSLENTQPPRAPHTILSNNPPDRPTRAAPGGRALRRSRLKILREKVDHYRGAKLARKEEMFRGLSFLSFDFIANGRWLEAGRILQTLGWEMNESTRSRLAAILSQSAEQNVPQAIETMR